MADENKKLNVGEAETVSGGDLPQWEFQDKLYPRPRVLTGDGDDKWWYVQCAKCGEIAIAARTQAEALSDMDNYQNKAACAACGNMTYVVVKA